MTRHSAMTGAAVAALLLLALTACGSRPAGAEQAAHIKPAATTSSPATTITIQPGSGETFTPTSTGSPALTAEQAFADFAHLNGWTSTAIPDVDTVQLGLLTLPVGPADGPGTDNLIKSNGEAYRALNQLVWAYSWKQCPPVVGPSPSAGASPAPTPSLGACIGWLFLDANTGTMIDQTYQQ